MKKVNLKNSILAVAIIAGLVGVTQSTKADSFRKGDHDDSGGRDYSHYRDSDGRDYGHYGDSDFRYYREYEWNNPYWYHHRYGYWHHRWGYWSYRGHDHIFISVD